MLSPSNTPQKKATIGIRYVTDETKIGVEIFTSFKNRIFAIAVAKKANNTTVSYTHLTLPTTPYV